MLFSFGININKKYRLKEKLIKFECVVIFHSIQFDIIRVNRAKVVVCVCMQRLFSYGNAYASAFHIERMIL